MFVLTLRSRGGFAGIEAYSARVDRETLTSCAAQRVVSIGSQETDSLSIRPTICCRKGSIERAGAGRGAIPLLVPGRLVAKLLRYMARGTLRPLRNFRLTSAAGYATSRDTFTPPADHVACHARSVSIVESGSAPPT